MFEKARIFFEEYCKNFEIKKELDLTDSFSHKYYHTYRVVAKMNELLKHLDIDEEIKELARVTALFHDLGRFAQLKKCKVYDDLQSHFNHAEESIRILKAEKWFENNNISAEQSKAIIFAIENHNCLDIKETKNELSLLLAKLIRDADKLAIMWEHPRKSKIQKVAISTNVLEQFKLHRLIDARIVKNKADELASTLAFTFDLNFKESYEILQKEQLTVPFYNQIEKMDSQKTIKILKEEIEHYLKEKEGITC